MKETDEVFKAGMNMLRPAQKGSLRDENTQTSRL